MTAKSPSLGLSLLICTLSIANFADGLPVIRTTAELREFRECSRPMQRTMDLTVQIVSSVENTIIAEDATGRAVIGYGTKLAPGQTKPELGDVVRLEGETLVNAKRMSWDSPTNITLVCRKGLPAPFVTRIDELDANRDDLKSVIIDGTVVSSFEDEIDTRYQIMIIKEDRNTLPIYVQNTTYQNAAALTGGKVRIHGVFYRRIDSYRFFPLSAVIAQRVEVLTPPPADPFNVPELKGSVLLTHDEIGRLGRRKIDGKVLAAWDGDRVMLKTGLESINVAQICFARLANGVGLPEVGSSVTIVGEVDASFFNLSLTDAAWKTAEPVDDKTDEPPMEVGPRDIFLVQTGTNQRIDTTFQGRLVRISGTLISDERDGRRMILNCDGISTPVDVSILPGSDRAAYRIGTRLRVTGRCLLEITRSSGYDMFPRITGFTVITRGPGDLEVLSLPPWWTPGRFLVVIAALLAFLLGFAIWIRILNRIVQRRSRELARAEFARASSELRIDERTRIAVELHDSISQNLTGIALAITAGEFKLAERSLKSCREELRNCLWDLRSNALESSDMEDAIRKTLAPNLMTAKLNLDFRLERSSISDTTVFAILRIIRELTVNGIRHGGATEITIEGGTEGKSIRFSVRDNGKGFDPDRVPGMDDGHFGLQGVRERVTNLNGEMEIESSPENGTKVSICLEKSKS